MIVWVAVNDAGSGAASFSPVEQEIGRDAHSLRRRCHKDSDYCRVSECMLNILLSLWFLQRRDGMIRDLGSDPGTGIGPQTVE